MYQHGKLKISTTDYRYKETVKAKITKSPPQYSVLSSHGSLQVWGSSSGRRAGVREEASAPLEGGRSCFWLVVECHECGTLWGVHLYPRIVHVLVDRHGAHGETSQGIVCQI